MKYEYGVHSVQAEYSMPRNIMYRDNPWIEALPEHLSYDRLLKKLSRNPPYHAQERQDPHHERQLYTNRLMQVFCQLAKSVEIASKISSAIREGYAARNPMDKRWMRGMGQLQDCVKDRDWSFLSVSGVNASACGFSVVGESGMGKTSAVNQALGLFPQMIFHSRFHDVDFPCVQIVWMRLECPFDASVKGLCTSFFQEFDKITGDNTYAKFAAGGRATTDQMIPQMALVAQRHGLGILIIDEIQNLSAAKSGGKEKMQNFIVQLVNTIGIPVLLIGTPPAIGMLSTDFKTARRSAGQQGITSIEPIKMESPEWNVFMDTIWQYQWTAESIPLSPKLEEAIYSLTKGNISLIIALYKKAQEYAITNGLYGKNELITPSLLRMAAIEKDSPFLPMQMELERKEDAIRKQAAAVEPAASKKQKAQPAEPEGQLKPSSAKQQSSTPKKRPAKLKRGEAMLEDLRAKGQLGSPDDEF